MFSKSLNLMSLAGFTVGMCMVIFNSVVVIDMLFSEALTGSVVKSTGGTRDRKDTIAYAVSKITRPLLAVTLTTIAVFLPILYMNKNTVSLYADFALSVSFMLLFSYLIAVFFIPACFTRFCPEILSGLRGRKPHGGFFDMIGGILTNIGFAGVKKVSKRSFLSLLMFTVISLIFFYFFITSEFEDISPLKEHQFELYYEFDPGYTHAYRTAAMLDIGREIMAMDLPLTLVSRLDESRASFFLHFPRKYSRLHDGIFMVYERLNTFRRKDGFFYFSADKRIGIRSFVVNLFGDDLETLHLTVDEVSQALSETHGVRQVLKGYRRGSPEIVLTVDPQNMYYHKLNAGEVIRMLRYVFYKPVIMKFYEGDHILDVRGVVGTSLYNKDDIMKLRVPNRNREFIALSDFASLTHEEGSGSITRMNGKRYVSIDVRYADVSADVLVGRVRSALKSVQQRDDFYYELDENLVTKRKSRALFLFSLALALFLEFLVLGTVFKSFKIPLIILITMPSLFIGGFLFLKISGFVRSVPAHLALIMLTGLSIKGVILMMEEVFRLKRMALEKKLLLVYRTKIRLLFLTTLTTLFSLLPVLFFATSSGFIRIVTGVISFGFMFSLLASLGIFPVLMGLILKSGSERIRR
jgi:HAE1 family hydrophobic/amphiphilic exporter-1